MVDFYLIAQLQIVYHCRVTEFSQQYSYFRIQTKQFAIHEIKFENWIQFYMYLKYKNMKNLLNRDLQGNTCIFLQIILTER